MLIIQSDKSSKNKPALLSPRAKKPSPLSRSNFAKMMSQPADEPIINMIFSDTEHLLSNLSVLIDEIEEIGQELLENPVPNTFLRYKKHISVLLKTLGKNTAIMETTARVGFTRTKLFRTAYAINEALADLAKKILDQEKNRIKILNLTQTLQGLILDIIA